jgi:hypothetical protein
MRQFRPVLVSERGIAREVAPGDEEWIEWSKARVSRWRRDIHRPVAAIVVSDDLTSIRVYETIRGYEELRLAIERELRHSGAISTISPSLQS